MSCYDKLIAPINKEISFIEQIPVIEGYVLVIGGGKVGTRFIEETDPERYPFVITIDIDPNASSSRSAHLIQTETELSQVLQQKTYHCDEYGDKKRNYFFASDLSIIPFILSHGFPEYIVPAVPVHIASKIVLDFASSAFQVKSNSTNTPLHNLSTTKFGEHLDYFNDIIACLPENLIYSYNKEKGIIILSYTKENEICPDECTGHSKYCPYFDREKDGDSIEHVKNLQKHYLGWVFESYQIGAGLGGISGLETKTNLIEILNYFVNTLLLDQTFIYQGNLFIATSCKCHGIIDLFSYDLSVI